MCRAGSADVPIALVNPITHWADWKGSFFYVENKIVPSDYPELLLDSYKFDKKSFRDKVHLHPELDPLYDQIATYPCHVRTFPDPILYLAGLKNTWKHSPKEHVIYYQGQEMDFRIFITQEIDDVADSDDASAGDNENPLVGTSLPPLPKAGKKLRSLGKKKLPSGVEDSLSKSVLWPKRTRELISALDKATASCDAIRARELEKDKAYAELERKCNESLLDLDKNPLVADMWTEIETLQGHVDGLHSECLESKRERLKLSEIQLLQEMDALKQDRASVVAKVVPDAAIKLIRSDEIGILVMKLVTASIIYGRCAAFKEVAKLKDPFVMDKMAGYRPSSKQKYDQAGDDLANASYPFLSKYVNDPYASLEQLLSKKPESLRSKLSYVKAK
nr:hypothetical protein [Tanacetum cinerariifolium]